MSPGISPFPLEIINLKETGKGRVGEETGTEGAGDRNGRGRRKKQIYVEKRTNATEILEANSTIDTRNSISEFL